MSKNSITSLDLSISQIFQDYYRVPDYQREYVWGERDAKGEGGEEVEQFLRDIHAEFEHATKDGAPEYFIGTIVVCPGKDDVYDLIDGQQRTTTSFLTLCALRDAIGELDGQVPPTLTSQISSTAMNWKGETADRLRLDLQYEVMAGATAQRRVVTAHARSATSPTPTTRFASFCVPSSRTMRTASGVSSATSRTW